MNIPGNVSFQNRVHRDSDFIGSLRRGKMIFMCGRYTLRSNPTVIAEAFGLFDEPAEFAPRYNIAPTQTVAAVVIDPHTKRRRLRSFVWGLIPSWADDPKIGNKLLNARAETIAEKPSFRDAFRKRRCLLVADGFYEWRREGKSKRPFHIRRRDGRPFGMAGLFEHWRRGDLAVDSCTIVTTTPNELMAELHDRMPVIVDAADFETWLDPQSIDEHRLHQLLKPAPAETWEAVEVGATVNRAGNETPDCLAAPPEAPPPKQVNRTLF